MRKRQTTEEICISLDQLFADFAEPLLLIDVESGKIRRAAQPCEGITGYCTHELESRNISCLDADAVAEPFAKRIVELLEQPGLHEEVHVRNKRGGSVLASVRVTRFDTIKRSWALLLLRDVGQRRKLERELITKHVALRDAYRELEDKNCELHATHDELTRTHDELKGAHKLLVQLEQMATIGRFAAGVAHEVNNPLTFVLENLREMRRSKNDFAEQYARLLDESLEGVERITTLVRKLNAFANVSDQDSEPVRVKDLVDSSVMLVRTQIRRCAELKVSVPEDLYTVGIPSRLSQVIVNLLVNAVHAIENSERGFGQIEVTVTDKGEHVWVEVSDDGCGIAPTNLKHIAKPFFTTKKAGEGTGLGLSLSSKILNEHQGELQIESMLNRGTTMRMVLPVMKADRPQRPVTRQRAPTALVRGAVQRILLVDDEKPLLRALSRKLKRAYLVTTAHGAADALACLRRGLEVDVILADMTMPRIDGVEFFELLREEFPELTKRFVFMTGGVFCERMSQFLRNHDVPVLGKPFEVRELRRVLHQFEESMPPLAPEGTQHHAVSG